MPDRINMDRIRFAWIDFVNQHIKLYHNFKIIAGSCFPSNFRPASLMGLCFSQEWHLPYVHILSLNIPMYLALYLYYG